VYLLAQNKDENRGFNPSGCWLGDHIGSPVQVIVIMGFPKGNGPFDGGCRGDEVSIYLKDKTGGIK
jgi:hypothetical protein